MDQLLNLSQPEQSVRHGWCPQGNIAEPLYHRAEIEAAIEAIFELGQIARGVLEVKSMESAGQRVLDVTQQGVDPLEGRMLSAGTATARDGGNVLTTPGIEGLKAG